MLLLWEDVGNKNDLHTAQQALTRMLTSKIIVAKEEKLVFKSLAPLTGLNVNVVYAAML